MDLEFRLFYQGIELDAEYERKVHFSTILDGGEVHFDSIKADVSYIPIDEVRTFDVRGHPVNTFAIKVDADQKFHVTNGFGLTASFTIGNSSEVKTVERPIGLGAAIKELGEKLDQIQKDKKP